MGSSEAGRLGAAGANPDKAVEEPLEAGGEGSMKGGNGTRRKLADQPHWWTLIASMCGNRY